MKILKIEVIDTEKTKDKERDLVNAILQMHDCCESVKPRNVHGQLIYPWTTLDDTMSWINGTKLNIISHYKKCSQQEVLL